MFLLYHGPDEFSAHEALARLRATHDFGYNQDTFTGAGADLATIRNTCDTMPFLSEQRLVVVDGLPKRKRGGKDDGADDSSSPPSQGEGSGERSAKSGKGKKGKTASGPDPKAFAAGLAEYVPSLPEFSILVLLADEVLDAASPLLKAAQKFGKAQAFLLPRGPQLEDWVARRAASHDAKLAPEAARLLAVEVGDNLRLLALEIEKLATYVGQGETIRVEDVRTLTPASRQAKVFDLTDALARRSEEHTSELQSQSNLVCRLLLEQKKKTPLLVQMALNLTRIGGTASGGVYIAELTHGIPHESLNDGRRNGGVFFFF